MKTENISTTEMLNTDNSSRALESMGGVQISGYDLVEKIGAGGYGEVWKAIGPGGLPKAIKVLFGERTGQHAESEMKALERMRDLRHPFLLSIERIEVVNSRLIVVTELADGNLTERFEVHRGKGLTGIPRDELLGYLRDAADALDFMAEQHGLQHLDIKPDNILLQGNHAKVGDFGLAKDLNATNVSVINGFTPMFAAPELFEGRPGRASDQYSLAIVYQLMLTGATPFNGRTAAQLTAQHLRSQPDLSELQPIDRPVIARALAKNMNSRFDNCRQFVDELSRRKHSRSNNRAFASNHADTAVHETALLKTQGGTDSASVAERESSPIAYSKAPSAGKTRRRTVLIGAGGTAGVILRKVRQYEDADAERPHDIRILQIDSDRNDITELKTRSEGTPLAAEETLVTPLRSSKEYRKARNMDLSWMSRRWLFNIPRSGQVDGIRPLGRLALYDHRETVAKRLDELLKAACDDRAQGEGVDVFVVASTSGGTGSGMLADIGLMVKAAIRRSALKDVNVNGLLIHGTGSQRNAADLQGANTVSLLTELRHLLTPGLETPRGFDDTQLMRQSSPFDHSYLFHLGDGLNDMQTVDRLNDVALYLETSATTDAQFDFHAWRTAADDVQHATQLRIIGMGSQDAASLQSASSESGNLCALLVRRWCGGIDASGTGTQYELPPELTDTQTLISDLKLTDDTSHDQVMGVLRGDVGKEIENYSRDIFARLINQHDADVIGRQQLLDFLAKELSSKEPHGERSLLTIVAGVQKKLAAMTESCSETLDRHLRGLLDTPHRLEGAAAASRFLGTVLRKTTDECRTQLVQIEEMFSSFANDGTPTDPIPGGEAIQAFCKQYCVLLSYQAIYQCYIRHVQNVAEFVATFLSGLVKIKDKLESKMADSIEDAILSDAIPQPVIDAFDKQLRSTHPDLLGKFKLTEDSTRAFWSELTNAATNFLVSAANAHESGGETARNGNQTFPQSAWPSIQGVGGMRRVLGMIPAETNEAEWHKALSDEFGNCVTVRSASGTSVRVVCELEQVPVESLLAKLTQNNPHIIDVAARIQLRTDIDW